MPTQPPILQPSSPQKKSTFSSRGDAYFHGCWFVRPGEIEHAPTRLFYKREVFLSSIEDTNPLGSVISKCCVLHIKDYCSCRYTLCTDSDPSVVLVWYRLSTTGTVMGLEMNISRPGKVMEFCSVGQKSWKNLGILSKGITGIFALTHIHPDTHTWVAPVETQILVLLPKSSQGSLGPTVLLSLLFPVKYGLIVGRDVTSVSQSFLY